MMMAFLPRGGVVTKRIISDLLGPDVPSSRAYVQMYHWLRRDIHPYTGKLFTSYVSCPHKRRGAAP